MKEMQMQANIGEPQMLEVSDDQMHMVDLIDHEADK